MHDYIITFFTHFDAVCCARSLKKQGIPATMSPVPRALSSSCGTCIQFSNGEFPIETIGEQFEQLFQLQDRKYILLKDNRGDS